jgi:hypothetical protein
VGARLIPNEGLPSESDEAGAASQLVRPFVDAVNLVGERNLGPPATRLWARIRQIFTSMCVILSVAQRRVIQRRAVHRLKDGRGPHANESIGAGPSRVDA